MWGFVVLAVIGLVILANAVNLFLLSTSAYKSNAAAYTTAVGTRSDALPQALILMVNWASGMTLKPI